MTARVLHCPRCTPNDPVERIGYVPLYRERDGRPVFVIVHEYSREAVDKLKFHDRVFVSRGPEQSDGTAIEKHREQSPQFNSRLPERNRWADLSETLLTVWGYPALRDWYRQSQRASVTMDCHSTDPSGFEKSGEPQTEYLDMDALADCMDANADRATERAAQHRKNADAARRWKEQSANGKHSANGKKGGAS